MSRSTRLKSYAQSAYALPLPFSFCFVCLALPLSLPHSGSSFAGTPRRKKKPTQYGIGQTKQRKEEENICTCVRQDNALDVMFVCLGGFFSNECSMLKVSQIVKSVFVAQYHGSVNTKTPESDIISSEIQLDCKHSLLVINVDYPTKLVRFEKKEKINHLG